MKETKQVSKIAQRMKERRKELGMSPEDLGKILGKDRSTIYRYEKGDIENLSVEMLTPIAKALKLDPVDLMGWEKASAEDKKISNTKAGIADRIYNDEEFMEVVEKLNNLNKEQFNRANDLLNLFFKEVFEENK